MKKSLIALALFAALGANAQDTTTSATSQAGSASQAGAQSGSAAVIYLDQSVPSQQTYTSTNNSTSVQKLESTHTSNETNNINYSGSQTVKNVPSIAMSGPASGPCTGASGGVGLAGAGFGLGFNIANVEPTCVVRENTRVLGMAMQSLDGAANPQQKGELMVMMMDAARGLAAMNAILINDQLKKK